MVTFEEKEEQDEKENWATHNQGPGSLEPKGKNKEPEQDEIYYTKMTAEKATEQAKEAGQTPAGASP